MMISWWDLVFWVDSQKMFRKGFSADPFLYYVKYIRRGWK